MLNAPLYLAPVISGHHPAAMPLALLYGIAFSTLAIVLRASLRSITAPLAANVAFQLFLALVALS